MLAAIGRAQAVAQIGPLHFSGLIAWLLWCVVHIFFLIGFRNRVRVMSEWVWYYITFKPGARVIYELPKPLPEEQRTSQARSAGSESKE
jgi:NADH dehydrogenase